MTSPTPLDEMNAYDALVYRLRREEETLENQLAVVGYLKLVRIERYIAGMGGDDQHIRDCFKALAEVRREVLRDVNIVTMRACLDFLIYQSDWKEGN